MYLTGNVQALIVSFIAVCAALILYDIACAGIFRRRDARVRRLAADTAGIEAALRTPRRMKSEERLLALENCLDAAAVNDPELSQRLREMSGEAFAKLLCNPGQTDEIVLAYIVYLAAKFGLFYHTANEALKTELLFLVTHEKLYLREIALHCIYSIGEEEPVLQALLRLDSSGVHHPRRLLLEGLKDYAGQWRELATCFAAHLEDFGPEMQAMLIEYISAGAEKGPAGQNKENSQRREKNEHELRAVPCDSV